MDIRKYRFWNTIRFRLVLGIPIFLAPFFMLLVYNNLYAVNLVRDQVAATNKNAISLYLEHIDKSLEDIRKYLADLSGTNSDLSIINSYPNEDEKTLAEVNLVRKLSKDIFIYKEIDTLFIYSLPKRKFIYVSSEQLSFNEINIGNTYAKSFAETAKGQDNNSVISWKVVEIGKNFYLYCIFNKGNIFAGAWLKAEKLLNPLSSSSFGSHTISLFVNDQGEPMNSFDFVQNNKINFKENFGDYYITGDKNKFLVVGENSKEGNFSIVSITPDNKTLMGFPYIEQVILFVSIAILIVMPIYLLILRRTVLVPVNRILSVIKMINKGNLEYRIKPFKTTEEFQILNESFNNMVNQIENLKISVYEEKISGQKAELEHLKLQVKPHFFLNSLGIIYNLSRAKSYDLLEEMTKCLIEYFRYMFKSNANFVFLKDELLHVSNYIRMQQFRYPNNLSVEVNFPDYVIKTTIPPLIIHTFVENTIKHSVTLDTPIHLNIEANILNIELKSMVVITISDTGKGFSEDVLEKIKLGDRIIDEQGEHTGIHNVQRRLSILYNGQAYLSCSNNANGGAKVEIFVPV
jgi:two-component system sensor histidine kinase YesM